MASAPERERGAEIVLVGAPDTAGLVGKINRHHDVDHGRIVCHVPPGIGKTPHWLAYEVLLALGKRLRAAGWPRSGPQALEAVRAWALGERVAELILYRADLARPAAVEEIAAALPHRSRVWSLVPEVHIESVLAHLAYRQAGPQELLRELCGERRRSATDPRLAPPPSFVPNEPWLARYEALEWFGTRAFLEFDRACVSAFEKADALLLAERRLRRESLEGWINAATANADGEVAPARMIGIRAAFCLHGLLIVRAPGRACPPVANGGAPVSPRKFASSAHAAVWALLLAGFSDREIEALDLCQITVADDGTVSAAGRQITDRAATAAIRAQLAARSVRGAAIGDRLIRPTGRGIHPTREVRTLCADLPVPPERTLAQGPARIRLARLGPRHKDPFYPTPRVWRGEAWPTSDELREGSLILDCLRANGYERAAGPTRPLAEELVARGVLERHYSGYVASEALRFSFLLDSKVAQGGRRPRAG